MKVYLYPSGVETAKVFFFFFFLLKTVEMQGRCQASRKFLSGGSRLSYLDLKGQSIIWDLQIDL